MDIEIDILKAKNKELQEALNVKNRALEVEAALETVRSRGMGMQRSDELTDVIKVVYEQLSALNIKLDHAGFVVDYQPKQDWHFWITDKNVIPSQISHPYFENIWATQFEEAKRTNISSFFTNWNFEEKNQFYKTLLSFVPDLPQASKQFYFDCPGLSAVTAVFEDVSLYIENFDALPYTEEDRNILVRFGKVFQQTYTRFLDLQKAEMQAREAEIQLALERVRAKAMAMQTSKDLKSVALELRRQMGNLGLKGLETCAIHLYDDSDEFFTSWAALQSPNGEKDIILTEARLPKKGVPNLEQIIDNYNYKKKDYLIENDPENFQAFSKALKMHAPESLEVIQQTVRSKKNNEIQSYWSVSDFNGGSVLMSTVIKPDDAARKLLRRFADVFDLAYRRFTDLQKAEAQAREAQIETALERVRSQAIGMQSSNDLHHVAASLFDQLRSLGWEMFGTAIVLCSSEKSYVEQWHSVPGLGMVPPFHVPVATDYIHQYRYQQWLTGTDLFSIEIPADFINEHFHTLYNLPLVKPIIDDFINKGFSLPPTPPWEIDYGSSFKYGYLLVSSLAAFKEASVLPRFAKVFEQAYTRFLDLQKAEAQAREGQIQLGLERVRARTMAMHKSEELPDTSYILFAQLKELGEPVEQLTIGIVDEENRVIQISATLLGDTLKHIYGHSIDEPYMMHKVYAAWKQQQKTLVVELRGDELNAYNKYRNELTKSDMFPTNFGEEHRRIVYAAFFSRGMLALGANEPRPPESLHLLQRFASVFELTYTRFLDLQKAEAQAREAEIELALERVRAKAMSMQHSDHLKDVIAVIGQQLHQMGLFFDYVNFIVGDVSGGFDTWNLSFGQADPVRFLIPLTDNRLFNELIRSRKSGLEFYAHTLTREETFQFVTHLVTNGILKYLPEEEIQKRLHSKGMSIASAVLNQVFLSMANYAAIPYTDAENAILKRFGNAFQQAYTRFLDLEKAELQAREAQVEAALEKVRSKAMSMYKSTDLSDAASVLFDEIRKLGIAFSRAGIGIISEEYRSVEFYSNAPTKDGSSLRLIGSISMMGHPEFENQYAYWKKKQNYFTALSGESLRSYYDFLSQGIHLNRDWVATNLTHYGHWLMFSDGFLFAWNDREYSVDEIAVLDRFKSVVEITFRRYYDLQNAEAQAREAKIEAALERVRSKAMSMHSSEDVAQTVDTFFIELNGLNVKPRRSGVGIIDKESRVVTLTATTATQVSDSKMITGHLKLYGHPVLCKIFDSWLEQQEYHPILRGNEIGEYYKVMSPQVSFPDFAEDETQYGYYFFFKEGGVFAWTDTELSEMDLQIFRRYTSVLSLTYRRYMELQKSEANAKEAIKQAALDRIRADIASMRTISDLDRITPLIWNELTILGIPFIRCGVFIMDESQQLLHTFLSTPDGKAIASFHLPFDTPGNLQYVVSNWKEKKNYIDHWDEKEFMQFAEILVQQGTLASAETYLKTIPSGGFHLHFLPFLQGLLYVGNTTQLEEEEINLIQSVADAFSTAYARYEDFNKLEAAKKQVDSTLNELQATQKQLIQSEKMASLGELTAGIAHEIQNPLNFVNNFSEVSKELLDEMQEALDKGDSEEAVEIARDLMQNLEKINHHGKRADGIVKGMLQHSRASSGKAEMTNINTLADEYLRLAYHGLRAKDKSFNATLETDFDETIGYVNVIPQDIGRVLLNVINNSFYAVNERKKSDEQLTMNYEPKVTISTKRNIDKVDIMISDNGNGIPKSIVDKIFQPFFTTKPTGQGTGLGLSLCYDIIKAHNGSMSVETEEGSGTTFIIQLPAG